ncbi:MAG: general glycosylation pathway protein [Thiohalospira sp.]
MSTLSYLALMERFQEHRSTVHDLLDSIITGLADPRLLEDDGARRRALLDIREHYPFVKLLYTLDPGGRQTSDNVVLEESGEADGDQARGRDRSQRPYFAAARDSGTPAVTDPYLSSADHHLCLSAATPVRDEAGAIAGYVVIDADLAEVIAFLMGDRGRRRFQPLFKAVYGVIVTGLFLVVAALLTAAGAEVAAMVQEHNGDGMDHHLRPFSAIIFLTLALAVFDLGKTILEEEVLMHKDIFRHSSTRRTITRFIAAILIAVSIEALLMMFKAALGDGSGILGAVWMMFAAVGLLVGLGIYVYLGARAETILLRTARQGRRQGTG